MQFKIKEVREGKRGCCYRKKGGIYLRSDGVAMECGKLPIELSVCPCCNAGIRFSRTPQWVLGKLLENATCNKAGGICPLNTIDPEERMLMIWVGEKFYPTPMDFINESRTMGLSRRIMTVPKGFEIGKTRVLFAHIKAIPGKEIIEEGGCFETSRDASRPGIFSSFIPSRIEYVVKGDETPEDLEALAKRGFALVDVKES